MDVEVKDNVFMTFTFADGTSHTVLIPSLVSEGVEEKKLLRLKVEWDDFEEA